MSRFRNTLVGLMGLGFVASPAIAEEMVCLGELTPLGYVDVRHTYDNDCQGPATIRNARIIKIPGKVETVCSGSPVPRNYKIVRHLRTSDCGSISVFVTNAMVIRRKNND